MTEWIASKTRLPPIMGDELNYHGDGLPYSDDVLVYHNGMRQVGCYDYREASWIGLAPNGDYTEFWKEVEWWTYLPDGPEGEE